MKISEGKSHLKVSSYAMLVMKMITRLPCKNAQSWNMSVFLWYYFVVMSNFLMRRSDSVDTIMVQHIEGSEDCLVIGHKGDQTGSEKFGKHIYSNPYNPEQCPILALSILLFIRVVKWILGNYRQEVIGSSGVTGMPGSVVTTVDPDLRRYDGLRSTDSAQIGLP
ncbi:hypothetical protein PHMEG_00033788 [Phytophthora megakarya]|uniref:Uncharacterized protein n=1 Tax=Phytophthora megakarya TaxID=4795 RepID=A0A225UU33_9STRA|nr:hypothetical protein PHMEG_00033788 [Phytophthora megakarya]